MHTSVYAYLAADRLAALAQGSSLPIRPSGTILSIDVVGFTRITEAFASVLGARRGADALADLLNQVYTALIAHVQEWNGSVVSFSGDAMRCWFAGDTGQMAFACASCIHQSIRGFAAVPLDRQETIAVAVKAAIVSGEVQRIGLGDPSIQIIDTLAGDLLTRLTALEELVQPGEIIMDEPTALVLSAEASAGSWREHPATSTRGAIVEPAATTHVPRSASAVTPPGSPPADAVRSWILPGIWDWLHRGMGDVRTELRPAVALFGQFGGIINEQDSTAISSLNEYVGWVQRVVKRYDGVVLQLTLGEKGNYFYAVFGALSIHEDDALRAVCAARDLQRPPADLAVGADLRVGIAHGIMRTGVYGSPLRRTYGVLGDAANLAARLMQHAARNEILASEDVAAATAHQVDWIEQEPIRVKGKRDLVSIYHYSATRDSHAIGLVAQHQLPMIGRQAELGQMLGYLDSQPSITGRAIAVTGEAGIGKSRLILELAAAAERRGWLVYSSECQSYLQNTPYSLWQPLLRALVGIEAGDTAERQIGRLESAIAAVNPSWLPRVPLLGPIVNLAIPDTDLTRSFDAQLRNVSREALVVDWLRAWVQLRQSSVPGIVLIFEDTHWIDPLSLSLLAAVLQVIAPLPVIVLLGYRPLDMSATMLGRLGNLVELPLSVLSPAAAGELIAAKAAQLGQPLAVAELALLVEQVYARTQGNPFYIEELLIYLQANQEDLRDPQVWERSELPTSLHQLLLSRIDQLSAVQQETLKVASVIGRLFRVAWLAGYQPALDTQSLADELHTLRAAALIVQESTEPELTYLFRHVIAQEVAYQSLAFSTRAELHERLGRYLERTASQSDDQRIYLIAYHYERSANIEKQREYLLRAGQTAQAAYANADALGYYQRVLPLLDDPEARVAVLLRLGTVLELVGEKQKALQSYLEAQSIVDGRPADDLARQVYYALGVFYRVDTDNVKALEFLENARALALIHSPQNVVSIDSQIGKVYFLQGKYDQAQEYLARYLTDHFGPDEEVGYSQVYSIFSEIAVHQGDYHTSHAYARKSLEVNRKESDLLKYCSALTQLGNALMDHGDLQECLSIYEESLAISRTIGAKRTTAVSLNNIAVVQARKYEFESAAQTYREALAIVKDLQEKFLALNVTTQLAVVLSQLGNFGESRMYFDEALALSDDIDSTWMRARLYIGLATFHSQQGHFAEVEHFNRQALAIATDNKTWMAVAISNLGSNSVDAGRLAEARPLLKQGLALAQEVDDKFLTVYVYYYLGFLAIEEGQVAEAASIFHTTLTLSKPINYTEGYMMGLIGLAYARTQIDRTPAAMAEAAAWMAVVGRTVGETRFHLTSLIRKWYNHILEDIQSSLPADQFAAAWASGQDMSLEQAVDQALSWPESA
jgi:predicted ATPase/class 3 adenylate cyclase